MTTYAVTAVGPDAPGEVAALAEALAGLGANLEDASMTRLRGHFAMTLVTSVAAAPEELESALRGIGLHVSVWDVSSDPPAPPAGQPWRVTVHGADRPGIVALVTRTLAAQGGNITDLTCRLVGALYVMTIEVELPDGAAAGEALAAAANELGVSLHLSPADEDLL